MKNRDTIIEAAINVISRHGVKRATMNDVAAEAGVARQTLYNVYANKEDLLRAMIRYKCEQSLAAIRCEASGTEDLGEKLDIFFRYHVIRPFEAIRSLPDSKDLIDGFNDAARDELAIAHEKHRAELQKMLNPHGDRIKAAGMTPRELSDSIQGSAKGAKMVARDTRHLLKLLNALKLMVLTTVGENPAVDVPAAR